jgi:hypothetical protein
MGIEPTALAWEARVLPLYDARAGRHSTRVSALWGARIMVDGVKNVCTWKVIAGVAVVIDDRGQSLATFGHST